MIIIHPSLMKAHSSDYATGCFFRWGLLNVDKQGGRWRTVNDLIIGDKLSNKEVHMSPEHAVAHRKKRKRYSAQLLKSSRFIVFCVNILIGYSERTKGHPIANHENGGGGAIQYRWMGWVTFNFPKKILCKITKKTFFCFGTGYFSTFSYTPSPPGVGVWLAGSRLVGWLVSWLSGPTPVSRLEEKKQ